MRSKFFIAMGLALTAAAAALALWNFHEGEQAAHTAQKALKSVEQTIAAETEPKEQEAVASVPDPDREMPTVEADGNTYIGTLEIPGIELELPVLSEWSDILLKTSPCRYTGSTYLDDMVIAGHNYRSHFGRLHELQTGDEVFFTDAEGVRLAYTVALMEQLPGDAIEEMQSGGWDLTLFTCTLGGQDRVTVRCERTKVE